MIINYDILILFWQFLHRI